MHASACACFLYICGTSFSLTFVGYAPLEGQVEETRQAQHQSPSPSLLQPTGTLASQPSPSTNPATLPDPTEEAKNADTYASAPQPQQSRPGRRGRPTRDSTACAHPLQLFSCEHCAESFRLRGELRTHVRQKHREALKVHRCAFAACSRAFENAADLAKHRRTHTGERPFSCSVCGRTFSDSSAHSRHEQTHRRANDPDSASRCSQCQRYARELSAAVVVLRPAIQPCLPNAILSAVHVLLHSLMALALAACPHVAFSAAGCM
jgi:hypothetical protein